MARDIDLTKPLSERDREYLLARGQEAKVFANDAKHSNDPEAIARALYIPGTEIDKAEGVPETPTVDPLAVNGGGDNDPDEDEGFSEGETEDYEGEHWDKAALVAEIDRRNREYDEEYQLARTGNKEELRARLLADDADSEDDE